MTGTYEKNEEKLPELCENTGANLFQGICGPTVMWSERIHMGNIYPSKSETAEY